MLFDVTAVLVTSLALTGVTGVIALPESAITSNPPMTVSSVVEVGPHISAGSASSGDPAAILSESFESNGLRAGGGAGASTGAGTGIGTGTGRFTGTGTGTGTGTRRTDGIATAAPVADQSRLAITAPALRPQLAPTRGHGATFSGSTARAVDSTLLPKLGGRALLDQLALLPASDIATFVHDDPEAVSALLADPPSTSAVSTWWKLVPERSRAAMVAGAPELIGNLDGLDPTLRDDANRTFLSESILSSERSIATLGRAGKADAEQRLHMLKEIEKSLVTTEGQPERTLLSVDTTWPGRAAVVVGDLATADYVSYMVPGMFFTVDGQIVDWTVISQDLYDEQAAWVHRLGGADQKIAGKSVAVVSWIGYQTPGITDIMSLDLARGGAKYISSAVNGLHTARAGDEPYVTLMTHSYGSTATMMALQDDELDTDALVIIGSPGSAAQSVDDIRMSPSTVFVGEAAWDPVVNTAFFGSDPGSDSFGASSMSVAGATDPITGATLTAASGHLGYFDAGTEAMRNMALVGLDRGDLVIGTGATTPGVHLADGR